MFVPANGDRHNALSADAWRVSQVSRLHPQLHTNKTRHNHSHTPPHQLSTVNSTMKTRYKYLSESILQAQRTFHGLNVRFFGITKSQGCCPLPVNKTRASTPLPTPFLFLLLPQSIQLPTSFPCLSTTGGGGTLVQLEASHDIQIVDVGW